MKNSKYQIRLADQSEHKQIGQLLYDVYAQLPGFPTPSQQPKYYQLLLNIGALTIQDKTNLLVAVDKHNQIAGAVIYFGNMEDYGAGGIAQNQKEAAGFRLLAVCTNHRKQGLGKCLSLKCIELAKSQNRKQLIIHSTHSMKIAWSMYENLGFRRSKDLDFTQSGLEVFGFRLNL